MEHGGRVTPGSEGTVAHHAGCLADPPGSQENVTGPWRWKGAWRSSRADGGPSPRSPGPRQRRTQTSASRLFAQGGEPETVSLPVPGPLPPCDEMSGTGETLLLRRGHRARSPRPAAVPQLWMSLQTPVPGPPGRRLMQCGTFSLSSNTADARFLPNVIARRAVARVWAPTLELSLQGLHR